MSRDVQELPLDGRAEFLAHVETTEGEKNVSEKPGEARQPGDET